MNYTFSPEEIAEAKITLASVKVYPRLSEETNCYTAVLVVNGTKAADMKNDGRGGCDMVYPIGYTDASKRLVALAEAYANSLPPRACGLRNEDDTPMMLDSDLESLVGDLIESAAEEQAFKRACNGKTVVILHSYEQGQYATIKQPYTQALAARLRKDYGADLKEIVNERYLIQKPTWTIPTVQTA